MRLVLLVSLLVGHFARFASAQTLAQLDTKTGPYWTNMIQKVTAYENGRGGKFVSIVNGSTVTPTNGDFVTLIDTNLVAAIGTNTIPFYLRIDEYVSGRGPGFYVTVEAQLGSSPSNIVRRVYQSFPADDSGWYIK